MTGLVRTQMVGSLLLSCQALAAVAIVEVPEADSGG